MERDGFIGFDPYAVPSPGYVVDLALLEENCQILDSIQQQTHAQILLALKGFSMFSTFPLIRSYLHGVCASSPDEARLGREEMGQQVHSYAAGFDEQMLSSFLRYSDHLIFNSFSLWDRFRPTTRQWQDRVSFGLRINPQQQEAETPMYDPSAPYSRLGITRDQFPQEVFTAGYIEGIEGFHIHNLCEQNSDALIRTWDRVEEDYSPLLHSAAWINLGGGHHITRADYDRQALIDLISRIESTYQVQVYLEPGEAVALDTGILVATVLDITRNGMPIAILDTSASCHMPDVLEMPYRPQIIGAAHPQVKPHTYRLGGMTCLAGDVIGDYSFDAPLEVGQRLIFTDMAHYTMVKTTTFNGIRLPSISTYDSRTAELSIIKEFGYEDFKGRLS
ncbi:MAG: carboxynorspermidine decarboxylase [Spirochaetia bacterium]|nr:carboxynorspermidine decarboxylase [Spirochaetia bacterium]MCF7940356.1 carboxynorspermidine decarboxylase [Spirochaetia bacterium]